MIRWVLMFAALAAASGVSAQQRSITAGSSQKADGFRGQNGRRVTFVCPATTVPPSTRVWGSDPYTDDSNICESAVHAGVLQAKQPGVVTIVVGGPQKAFKGSTRNGVTSNAYGSWLGSMSFDTTGTPGQVDWTTSAQWLPPDFQTPVVVSCPAQGTLTARIWGTDTYHQDSAICVAAVHAGVITAANGGLVTLTPKAGTLRFTAAARNGVSSVAYHSAGGSFQLAAAQAMIGPGPGLQAVTAQAPTLPPPTGAPVAQSSAFIGPAPVLQSATTAPPPAATTPANTAEDAACGAVFANPCAVALNPATIKVNWASRAEATKYQVLRDDRLIATVDTQAREFVDDSLTPGQSAAYTVKAVRVTGTINLNGPLPQARRSGDTATTEPSDTTTTATVDQLSLLETSNSRSATTPMLAIPTNVTAQSVGGPKGRVRVSWAPVAGANGYLVYRNGNPLPIDSNAAASNASYDTGVPLGRHRYQVEALFTTANTRRTVNGDASAEAFAEVVFPQPAVAYLSQQGGPASADELDAHYRTLCSRENAHLDINDCAKVVPILDTHTNFTKNWGMDLNAECINKNCANWTIVKFADVNVLGLGRRVNCAPRRQPADPILCWATSHGSIPSPGATINGRALASAAENVHNTKSLNVILAYPNGRMFFGTWENGQLSGQTPFDREFNFASFNSKVRYGTALDSQNVKPVPHVCLSCHGGRYDPTSKLVVGASLLPLVPTHLEFSSQQARENQEESIRQINEIVLSSNPAPAIVAQINALYNGAPRTPGTRANDAGVPAGWRFEPNIYRQIVEPYCASCHFSRQGPMSFATATNMKTLKGAVQNSICNTFTMPHSEIQFRRFWTEGGMMSLPGLLSTWLGFNTCGP